MNPLNLKTTISTTVLCTMSLSLLFALPPECDAKEVNVRTPSGENLIVDVEPEDKFFDVIEHIEEHLNILGEEGSLNVAVDESSELLGDDQPQREFLVDYMVQGSDLMMLTPKAKSTYRNYTIPVKSSEKSDVKYIVTTLGNSSPLKIASSRSSLKKAGDRIDNLHPLRFVGCIFSDEEMKAAIHNMQGRSWVWGEFLSNINDSFSTEANNNNLNQFVQDFTNNLNIGFTEVNNLIANRQWTDLIDYLIKTVPRKGNPGRYDM